MPLMSIFPVFLFWQGGVITHMSSENGSCFARLRPYRHCSDYLSGVTRAAEEGFHFFTFHVFMCSLTAVGYVIMRCERVLTNFA